MKAKDFIRVGRFKLTPFFAERVCKHYARRVTSGAMPAAIHGDLQSPHCFGEPVNAKSRYLLNEIGGLAEATDERAIHAATQRIADRYGLGPLPSPTFPEPEKPEPPKGEESDKNASSDHDDEAPESDANEEGDPTDARGEDDTDESEADSEGDGSGESDADGESGDSPGDVASDTESEGESADAAGSNDEPEQADSEAESDDAGNGSSFSDRFESVSHIDSDDTRESFARVIDSAKSLPIHPHPITPIPEQWLMDKEGRSGYDRQVFDHSDRKIDLGSSGQLIARLRAELMSVSRHRVSRDKDSGDVDFTKLVDLAQRTSLDRVFCTVTTARRLNTAVQIIIDVSGSMIGTQGNTTAGSRNAKQPGDAAYSEVKGSKIGVAVTCALLLCDCLEKLRVAVEVLAFSDSTVCVKPWNEKMHSARDKIARLACISNTNLPNAMLKGLRSLATRREEKHVQAVIIDGDIGCASTINHQTLSKWDPKLRTYGFGVGVALPKDVFTRQISNLTTANMIDQIVEQLRDALLHN